MNRRDLLKNLLIIPPGIFLGGLFLKTLSLLKKTPLGKISLESIYGKYNPHEHFFFRTWVERYVITVDGETKVDSPEGGIHGFPETLSEKEILRTFFVPKL